MNDDDRVKRLRWKCRRGMKELDVLFESFLEQQAEALGSGGWPELDELLEQEDDVLFDWISGRNRPTDPALLNLIETLCHAK